MQELDAYDRLHSMLGDVTDPRKARGKRHELSDVLFIILVGVLSGAEDADAIEDFAEHQEEWFRQRCSMQHGVPSQDTYLRVLAMLDPSMFGKLFQSWVQAVWGPAQSHVAIDGKSLRRSFNRATGVSPVHSVAAFASELGLVLGQVAVKEKENEIIAIPRLLSLIDLNGATVTIDAMGCQTAIASAIVEAGADYILQVKNNQPTLRSQIEGFFDNVEKSKRPLDDRQPEVIEATETDGGHGRVEERRCRISKNLSWIDRKDSWTGLSAIAEVSRRRENISTGQSSYEKSYFILSKADATAADVNALIRSHWAIENSLHWVLDVTFNEDCSRIRVGNAAENLGIIRRTALNLLRNAPNPGRKRQRVGIARRRRYCMMSPAYRDAVLRLTKQG